MVLELNKFFMCKIIELIKFIILEEGYWGFCLKIFFFFNFY